MRMSDWTPRIADFMADAARGTDYFGRLASIVEHEFEPGATVLDAGCGTGELALALAGRASRVDALDSNPVAIDRVRAEAQARSVANVHPVCADMFDPATYVPAGAPYRFRVRPDAGGAASGHAWAGVTSAGVTSAGATLTCGAVVDKPSPAGFSTDPFSPDRLWSGVSTDGGYDLAVFCLSVKFEEAYAVSRWIGARRMVVVSKIHSKMFEERARLQEGDRPCRPVVDDFTGCFERYRAEVPGVRGFTVGLEFGQPLRSLEEAREYYALFRNRAYPEGPTDADLARELVRRDDDEFPLYLPARRHLAVFSCAVFPNELEKCELAYRVQAYRELGQDASASSRARLSTVSGRRTQPDRVRPTLTPSSLASSSS